MKISVIDAEHLLWFIEKISLGKCVLSGDDPCIDNCPRCYEIEAKKIVAKIKGG